MNVALKKILGVWLALAAIVCSLSAQSSVGLGNLPLWFEAGQGSASSQFTAHGRDAQFTISSAGAGFTMCQADGHLASVRIEFVGGAVSPKVSGESLLSGKINYFTGNDPVAWKSGISTFGRVRMDGVYPGVNAVFYGNGQQLEYDLDLASGANPDTVRIRYQGAEKLAINPQGELVIGLNGGDVTQHQPVAYQIDAAGVRHDIFAAYKLLDAHTIGFALGEYDHNLPLAIDPILGYATYFGGNYGDIGWAIALDSANNIYIAGQTFSTFISNDIPFTTPGVIDSTNRGGKVQGTAFVAELGSAGTNLVYCTYLGGNGDDVAYTLAVDPNGNAYVAGDTTSTNFPVKNWISSATFNGTIYNGSSITNSSVYNTYIRGYPVDAFVAKISPGGTNLDYSTLLGGNSSDIAVGIALDPLGDAYVDGVTFSTNFPVTSGAYQTNLLCTNSYANNCNAFVSEISPDGQTLLASTYLGGTNFDQALAISYTNGYIYVAGMTASTNFPWVNGLMLDASNREILNNFTNNQPGRSDGASDAFVTTFYQGLQTNSIVYSTFLGSSNEDVATGIVGDGQGDAYVVGWTTSTNFPVTSTNLPNYTNLLQLGSYVRTNPTALVLATNAFLTQLLWTNATGTGTNVSVGFSQVFGGFGIDVANGVALDGAGDIFVVGSASSSSNYPTAGNLFGSLKSTNSSRVFQGRRQSDVVVTAFQAGFSNLLYSTYLGGRENDYGNAIAVDSAGNAYITGQTMSTNFPTATNYPAGGPSFGESFRKKLDGTNDAFVAKIVLNATFPPLFIHVTGRTNGIVGWIPYSSETIPGMLNLETITNLTRDITYTNIVITETTSSTKTNYHTNLIVVPEEWQDIDATNVFYTNGAYQILIDPATNQMQFYRFRPN